MLRAQAFEGLFTLVPILLVAVVSILLRARGARRRKQREQAAGTSEAAGTPPTEDTGRIVGSSRPSPGVYPPPLNLNDLKRPPASAGLRQPALVPPPGGPPGRELRRPAVRSQDLRERMQAREEPGRAADRKAADRRAAERKTVPAERGTIAARLERLPPLKRAVLWAEILGPPGGRQ